MEGGGCNALAGFCINLGFTVRGMDFAIESGRLAAETIIKAHERADYSAQSLAAYKKALDGSFIMRYLKQYQGFPALLGRREIFELILSLATDIAAKAFTVDGKQGQNLIMYALDVIARQTSATEIVNTITSVLEAF